MDAGAVVVVSASGAGGTTAAWALSASPSSVAAAIPPAPGAAPPEPSNARAPCPAGVLALLAHAQPWPCTWERRHRDAREADAAGAVAARARGGPRRWRPAHEADLGSSAMASGSGLGVAAIGSGGGSPRAGRTRPVWRRTAREVDPAGVATARTRGGRGHGRGGGGPRRLSHGERHGPRVAAIESGGGPRARRTLEARPWRAAAARELQWWPPATARCAACKSCGGCLQQLPDGGGLQDPRAAPKSERWRKNSDTERRTPKMKNLHAPVSILERHAD